MSHVGAPLQLDAQFLHEPNAHLGRLGVDSPVHRAIFPDGSPGWLVTGHAEARALLADPRLRNSRPAPEQDKADAGGPRLPAALVSNMLSMEPVEVGGVEIPAGDRVMVSLLGANYDARRFPDPHRLEVSRAASGHLAFGHGIHYCLGAPLARLEAEIAFRGLLERFGSIKLDGPSGWRNSMTLHGLESLPVAVT